MTRRIAQGEHGGDNAEAITRLVQVAKAGLPQLDFDERRAFLEGLGVQIRADGDQITITGLITVRTLSLAAGA